MSNRGKQWLEFSDKVFRHIEKYVVPQYEDAPNDPVEEWTAGQCVKAIEKYTKRFGKNSREGQQELDFLKIAHYACLANSKCEEV